MFVFEPRRLLDLLDEEAGEAGEEGLRDLGHRVLPQLVRDGGGREYRFEGYWQDVGTVDSYWSAHMDLLAADAPIRLDDPEWPIYTVGGTRGPARVLPGALVGDAPLAPGVRGYGIVDKAVLGPGVTVKEGATVKDAVVLHDTVIEPGATVVRAVVDSGVRVLAGARVGGPHTRDADNNAITWSDRARRCRAAPNCLQAPAFPLGSDPVGVVECDGEPRHGERRPIDEDADQRAIRRSLDLQRSIRRCRVVALAYPRAESARIHR